MNSTIIHTVCDLQPGAAYEVYVTAENAAGEGPPSRRSSLLTIAEECLCPFPLSDNFFCRRRHHRHDSPMMSSIFCH